MDYRSALPDNLPSPRAPPHLPPPPSPLGLEDCSMKIIRDGSRSATVPGAQSGRVLRSSASDLRDCFRNNNATRRAKRAPNSAHGELNRADDDAAATGKSLSSTPTA
eukprot:215114-Pyramimonas_sp.AAC.1